MDGNGSLVITAIKETLPPRYRCWYGACQYTSARLITKKKFEQVYGRFEARIKIPFGQGLWPAFWMLANNIDKKSWPACGEIDVMENIGREPAVVHGTIHGPGYSGGGGIGAAYASPDGSRFADNFHLYGIEWEPNAIRWYVDGKLYQTRTPADLPAGTSWVFDHPFFIILNVAVGGNWPGEPDATTKFPQTMLVDYVRVYQRR
jgi:beta-glucanase (GH16 family)